MAQAPILLFVDDESNILSGLRRGLRSRRHDWDMHFALGAAEALPIVTKMPVDIIISDMRMPQMDGAELLEKVRILSPDTARVILSGYAEEEAILKAIGPAHQYLAKPCDFDMLQQSLDRIISLRTHLSRKDIRALIGERRSLPSLPHIYADLMQALERPDCTNKTLGAIIQQDLGLTTQIMKVANSAFFGLARHVADLETAISMLGIETIRSMSLLNGIFSSFNGKPEQKMMMERLCQNSHTIGQIAHKIAEQNNLDPLTCKRIASAGTLSHIGTLIIAISKPEDFSKAAQLADHDIHSIDYFERDIIGSDHAAIGSYFLGLWGFPLDVCEAVAFHHRPHLGDGASNPLLSILHIAQQLAKTTTHPVASPEDFLEQLDPDFLAQEQTIAITPEAWLNLAKAAHKAGATR